MKINNEWQVKNNPQEAVSLFEKFIAQLANTLPTKVKPFFMSLILGALLAIARRRTVTQWLRAAQISDDYRQTFYHIPNIGRKGMNFLTPPSKSSSNNSARLSSHRRTFASCSPTKRYGRRGGLASQLRKCSRT